MAEAFLTVGGRNFTSNDYTIEECCGKHDLLTVRGTSMQTFDRADAPVRFLIDNGARSREVAGYLDTPISQSGKFVERANIALMLGASSAMRSGTPRSWTSARPFDIAREIVRPYGFCLEMDRYNFRIPYFSQTTDSDWQALNRLADECGAMLIGTNTVIRIIDPVNEIRRLYNRPFITFNVPLLRSYTVSRSVTPVGYEQRKFVGIDKFGQTFEVTANEGSPVSLLAPESVQSLEEALSAKQRLERRRHRLHRAQIVTQFNPIIRSGMTIGLSSGLETKVWLVLEAQHTFTHTSSGTVLSLCRDEDEQTRALNARNPKQWPSPVLRHDHWTSSVRWEREL